MGGQAALTPVRFLRDAEAALVLVRCHEQQAALLKEHAQLIEGLEALQVVTSGASSFRCTELVVQRSQCVGRQLGRGVSRAVCVGLGIWCS